MIRETGVPTQDDIKGVTPPEDVLRSKAVAVIECYEEIPCNPCATSCPTHAIEIVEINDKPKIDYNKCTGCCICVSVCPGLAIFVVDQSKSEDKALVKIPYEYLPIPKRGEVVEVTDREGKVVGKGTVKGVLFAHKKDQSAVVSIEVDKSLSMVVRSIKLNLG